MVRSKHFTEIEIFAYIGGLLGLFFGISVLSMVEIFYLWLVEPISRDTTLVTTIAINVKVKSSRSKIRRIRSYVRNYFHVSSIHSFNYIGDKSMRVSVKVSWIAIFALSMAACTFMIMQMYSKLSINKVTIIAEDEARPISEIPFPAVTIFGTYPVTMFYGPDHLVM